MKGKSYLIFLVLTFVVNCLNVFGQSDLEMANTLFKSYQYVNAIPYYESVIEKKENTMVLERLGDCYRMIGNSKTAESYYEKALRYPDFNKETKFNYAQVLRNNEKYEEAQKYFQEYLKANPSKKNIVDPFIEACSISLQWKKTPLDVNIENVSKLNTAYSDWNLIKFNNGFMFSSDRKDGLFSKSANNRESIFYGWTGNSYLKLFTTTYDSVSGWTSPKALDKTINTEFHNAAATFDEKNQQLYYTRTNLLKNPGKLMGKKKGDEFVNKKELYIADFVNGEWKNIRAFPFNNALTYSIQHPCLNKEGDLLYFSSDMPGGFGGFDIYYSEKIDGKWSTPVNIGKDINTTGDEGFPYISTNSEFYFSSNGLIGMGGLDIFIAQGEKSSWENIRNLQFPMNSSKDDFGILFTSRNEGYFSSDREGGIGNDDIYKFKFNAESTIASLSTIKKSEFTNVARPGKVVYKIITVNNIYYAYKSYALNKRAKYDLDKVVVIMKKYPGIVIEVGAHTDSRAPEDYNQKLSQQRAESALNYLVSKGIDKKRLVAKGYGESELVNNCSSFVKCNEAEHQENRRTEFKVLEETSEELITKD